MVKKYRTVHAGGHLIESSSPYEAWNFANYGDQRFYLSNKEVTPEEFYSAVSRAMDDAWEKKLATHMRVRTLHGASAGNYVTKWVRR